MLVRYTRQLATAALIVAAGLGMGACSAHPGAAVITNNGDYSIAEVDEAVSQIATVTAGKSSIDAYEVRVRLINEPQLVAVADSVGLSVTDEQIDQAIEQTAAQTGAQVPAIGRGTRATVRAVLLNQQLSQFAQMNPAAVPAMNETLEQARGAANAQINPRFAQPTLGGGQAPTMPLFGDAVSGAKDDPTAALLGGNAH
ncbi:putative lipoprotein [Actinomyces sp. ICM54]|uniref:hypothetical protein n=1 Tax=Actinomyces sp. ICM54 TaxID=936549 RepID=UPI00044F1C2A|nr:hypothetical protein [Actinomyces sp. ICM54]EWC98841.1 putative lipoprotein [Actinomyces sp. ICM54]